MSGASLFSTYLANTPLPWKWYYFRARFNAFLANLDPTTIQVADAATSLKGVITKLNTHYWGYADETAHAAIGGGWGKGLAVRPLRDVDLFFLLPSAVHHRFEQRIGNRQSMLLQEVKDILVDSYPRTDLRGDGQVVVVPFDHVKIEIVPTFELANGRLLIGDSGDGGCYRETDLAAEFQALDLADSRFNGCARPLIRMAKQWQRECSVNIKSFLLERLVVEFLRQADQVHVQYRWWDWLLRDFFAYMTRRANGVVIMPGTGEQVFLGDDWLSRAQTAWGRTAKACDYEKENENYLAGSTWQYVFGTMIPASAV